jgi:hypothetical protein
VIVLGAHVPISGWTVAVLLAGAAFALRYGRALGRRSAWQPEATVVALVSLTGLLALTITPDDDGPPLTLRQCVPLDPELLAHNALHTGGGLGGDLLNGLLTLPLTLALTMATGRAGLVIAVAVTMPAGIELVQTLLPGRFCAISDYLANSLGGLLGVGLGILARRWLRTGSGKSA